MEMMVVVVVQRYVNGTHDRIVFDLLANVAMKFPM